ncbi:hypothetical protein M422DRAFT_267672 [Sphaerobolus stellatus SS14]|uniref:Unplaced genomic scaffold SPHSTscaffold_180, whole genome shotgun sequence n=1 Tax=Sphaerobolus stellatus (strain SS14) TaxID=990650 RepID=A0A0C9UZX7_SPHS4|nr:hypothetical protein M422DRAFT_267672 [Sphaerobolus stellatus SS14]
MDGQRESSNPNAQWRSSIRPQSRAATSSSTSSSSGGGPLAGNSGQQQGSTPGGTGYKTSTAAGGRYEHGLTASSRYADPTAPHRSFTTPSPAYPPQFFSQSVQSSPSAHRQQTYPAFSQGSSNSSNVFQSSAAPYGHLQQSLPHSSSREGAMLPGSVGPYTGGYRNSPSYPLTAPPQHNPGPYSQLGRAQAQYSHSRSSGESSIALGGLQHPSSSSYGADYASSPSSMGSPPTGPSASFSAGSPMMSGGAYFRSQDSSSGWSPGYQGQRNIYSSLETTPLDDANALPRLNTNIGHHSSSRSQLPGQLLSPSWSSATSSEGGYIYSPAPSSASTSYLRVPADSGFYPPAPIDSRDTASPASSSSSSSVTFVPFNPGQATLLAHKITEDKSLSEDKLNEIFPPSSQWQPPPSASGKTQTGKKWICQWSNCKKAVRRQDRMAHALEHYGRKRFQCSCGHAFARTQDKRRHLREQATCKTCLRPVGRNGVDGVCSACLAENAKKNSSGDAN